MIMAHPPPETPSYPRPAVTRSYGRAGNAGNHRLECVETFRRVLVYRNVAQGHQCQTQGFGIQQGPIADAQAPSSTARTRRRQGDADRPMRSASSCLLMRPSACSLTASPGALFSGVNRLSVD